MKDIAIKQAQSMMSISLSDFLKEPFSCNILTQSESITLFYIAGEKTEENPLNLDEDIPIEGFLLSTHDANYFIGICFPYFICKDGTELIYDNAKTMGIFREEMEELLEDDTLILKLENELFSTEDLEFFHKKISTIFNEYEKFKITIESGEQITELDKN